MSIAKGTLTEILIDWETTYGADPAAPVGLPVPFNSFELGASRNATKPATMTGTRKPVAAIYGNRDVAGSVVVPVDLVNMGHWLKALMGAPATTGASAPYTHVFKPLTAIPSMVIQSGFNGMATSQFFKYNGVKVDSLSIDVGGDGELVATLEMAGAKLTVSDTSYDATPATKETFSRLQQFEASLKEGGSTIANATNLSFTIKNSLDKELFVIGGGGIRGGLPEGLLEVSGKLTILFEDVALYTKALATTESSLECTFTKSTHSLAFKFPELTYKESAPVVTTPLGIRVELEFDGFYDNNADTEALVVTLINTKASYA